MTTPHILMCPPDYFGIHYEINPWMNRSRGCDRDLAVRQWTDLRLLLESVGAKVSTLTPVEGLPDLVFTANAALIYQQRAILSNFRHGERTGEEPHFAAWLSAHGFEVEVLDKDDHFEGAGDALFCGDTLLGGYRIRSHARAHHKIGRMLDCRVLPLELVDNYYYHLDTCFCPLAPGVAIYHPGAFDRYGRDALAEAVGELIPVTETEAKRFACNAVVVGRHVVTNTGCAELHRELKQRGFTPHETPLSEFVKSGGSAKCLTLRIEGEEAAAWRVVGDGEAVVDASFGVNR